MTKTSTRLVNCDDFDSCVTSIRAKLFGELVKHSMPVVKYYHSDLYHDALWISQHVNGKTEFQWLVRPSGTSIFTEPKLATEYTMQTAGPDAVLYRVELGLVGPWWTVTFDEVTH